MFDARSPASGDYGMRRFLLNCRLRITSTTAGSRRPSSFGTLYADTNKSLARSMSSSMRLQMTPVVAGRGRGSTRHSGPPRQRMEHGEDPRCLRNDTWDWSRTAQSSVCEKCPEVFQGCVSAQAFHAGLLYGSPRLLLAAMFGTSSESLQDTREYCQLFSWL